MEIKRVSPGPCATVIICGSDRVLYDRGTLRQSGFFLFLIFLNLYILIVTVIGKQKQTKNSSWHKEALVCWLELLMMQRILRLCVWLLVQ